MVQLYASGSAPTAGNTLTTGLTQSGEIVGRFVESSGVTVEKLPVPAFFNGSSAKKSKWGISSKTLGG